MVPRGRSSKRTRKSPVPRVPAIYIWNVALEWLLVSDPVFLRQSFPSVRVSRARKEDVNVHLHMPLAEFPLHPILITNIEVGLNRDHGFLEIHFPARGSFVLDIHSERTTCVGVVEG